MYKLLVDELKIVTSHAIKGIFVDNLLKNLSSIKYCIFCLIFPVIFIIIGFYLIFVGRNNKLVSHFLLTILIFIKLTTVKKHNNRYINMILDYIKEFNYNNIIFNLGCLNISFFITEIGILYLYFLHYFLPISMIFYSKKLITLYIAIPTFILLYKIKRINGNLVGFVFGVIGFSCVYGGLTTFFDKILE